VNARCASSVVPVPVVPVWYERPVCWKRVVQKWYQGPVCGRHVTAEVIPEERGSRSRPVVRGVIPDVCGTDRTLVVAGVLPGWGGRRMRVPVWAMATGSPNPPMQPTPLRVPKILAFLNVRIGANVIPIDEWRRG